MRWLPVLPGSPLARGADRVPLSGRARALLRACVLGGLLATPAPALADPVRLQDLELLLEGGVGEGAILRHMQRWGLERDLDAADLVALKRAGASEALLEELAGTRSGTDSSERVVSLPGGRGILITNLDEQGRRIGGEAPESARVNRVESLPAPAQRAETAPEPPQERLVEPPSPTEASAPGYELGLREAGREAGLFWGTPGGYTRFKLYYSRAPYDGFHTWVPPVVWLTRVPVLAAPAWGGAFAPPFIVF